MTISQILTILGIVLEMIALFLGVRKYTKFQDYDREVRSAVSRIGEHRKQVFEKARKEYWWIFGIGFFGMFLQILGVIL